MNKLTRRELIAGAATVAAASQASAMQAPTTAEDWGKAAREANRANAEALKKIKLPMATEPAFAFKA